jgi:rRNA pseudouridine-1189 N-methylase Emg1 (Nep1/Mra1 family)
MTEHDYEKAMKLLKEAEDELRQGRTDIAHVCLLEAMSLLRVNE